MDTGRRKSLQRQGSIRLLREGIWMRRNDMNSETENCYGRRAQLEQNVKTGLMTDTLAVELFIVKNSGKQ